MSLSFAVIGILANDDHPDLIQGGFFEGCKNLSRGGIDGKISRALFFDKFMQFSEIGALGTAVTTNVLKTTVDGLKAELSSIQEDIQDEH